MKIRLLCVGLVGGALLSAAAIAQQTGAGEKPADAAVDEKLLDSLGEDLLEGLDDLPADPAFDQPGADPADKPLLDQLEGEDLGAEGENDLSRISRQMRLVQERIAQQEVSQKTQELQQQIVADLDALIEQIQQNMKRQSSPKSGSAQQTGGDLKQPGQQPDAGQEKPSDKPARDSQERLTEREANPADAEAMQALVKRVWGHLPDRVRQEMQNAAVEEFLPKYQELIEDYFRRLAEDER